MAKKEVSAWQEQLNADAKRAAVDESTPSKYISLAGGCMKIGDEQIPNNMLSAVVLAAVVERTWYDRPYNPEDKGPPECFALGVVANSLVPHDNVPEANRPASKCTSCPKAEFGTALQGKGPACKTRRRLVLMPTPSNAESIPEGDLAVLKVPPTSCANWSKYSSAIAGKGLPAWAVSTTIKAAPHPKKQVEVLFSNAVPMGEDCLAAIHARLGEADQMGMYPFEYEEEKNY